MKAINQKKTGLRIIDLMVKNNITVKGLSVELMCTPQCIYKWRNGMQLPSIDNLAELSGILKCKIDDILVIEDV